jgi:hypothetical protein
MQLRLCEASGPPPYGYALMVLNAGCTHVRLIGLKELPGSVNRYRRKAAVLLLLPIRTFSSLGAQTQPGWSALDELLHVNSRFPL